MLGSGSEWKLLSHIQLFATPWTIQSKGIFQARILEWVAIPFSRGSSQPGIEPRSPALQADCLPAEPQGKFKNTGVGSPSLLQGIFPIQELNWGLLHCRQIFTNWAIGVVIAFIFFLLILGCIYQFNLLALISCGWPLASPPCILFIFFIQCTFWKLNFLLQAIYFSVI